MAGLGKRFQQVGIEIPKYKIVVKGKSLFEWSISSLSRFFDYEFIFISREEIWDALFVGLICKKLGIRKFSVIFTKELTDGQATTAMLADSLINAYDAVAIYNIDTYIEPDKLRVETFEESVSGIIPIFEAEGDKWSFVVPDDNSNVKLIVEKRRISQYATIGFYYFSTWASFKQTFNRYSQEIKKEYGEVYIAPMYQYLIDEGKIIKSVLISSECVSILGTPEDLILFQEQNFN